MCCEKDGESDCPNIVCNYCRALFSAAVPYDESSVYMICYKHMLKKYNSTYAKIGDDGEQVTAAEKVLNTTYCGFQDTPHVCNGFDVFERCKDSKGEEGQCPNIFNTTCLENLTKGTSLEGSVLCYKHLQELAANLGLCEEDKPQDDLATILQDSRKKKTPEKFLCNYHGRTNCTGSGKLVACNNEDCKLTFHKRCQRSGMGNSPFQDQDICAECLDKLEKKTGIYND